MLSSSFLEMRNRNAVKIMQAVREQPGSSRADIARICDLAKSTVSSVVDELVRRKILEEIGSKISSRGRRPVGVIFNPSAQLAVGISIDVNRMEIALCDLDGLVQAVRVKRHSQRKNVSSVSSMILTELEKLLAEKKFDKARIGAVGLAVPGPFFLRKDDTHSPDDMDYDQLRQSLSEQLGCSVLVDSNTNMAALAESRSGAARESEQALVVRLGHEVRSALLIEHKLLKAGGRAGELGHIPVPDLNEECHCGKHGCINAIAAMGAIVNRCQSAGGKQKFEDIDDVINAAVKGNVNCKKALMDAGQAIGYGIAICINLLAPFDVIVTGRLVGAGDLLLKPLRMNIAKYAMAENLRNCNLVFDDSQSNIEAIGAALAAILQDDFMFKLVGECQTG